MGPDTGPALSLSSPAMSPRYFVLALALPLAACGNDDAATTPGSNPGTTATADPMVATPAPMDPLASDVTVDGTIAAAGSDITMMSVPAAVANINGWIAKLQGDQFAEIRTTLERLKLDLAATPINNAALGATLSSLGTQTTAAAAGASTSSQEGLRTLGGALSAAGTKLSGSTM